MKQNVKKMAAASRYVFNDRAENIEDSELERYSEILNWGYGKKTKLAIANYHESKDCILPIVATSCKDSNVEVSCFGYNFYSYFLAMRFKEYICASFLWPVSEYFGDPGPSSHINTLSGQPLSNFQKAKENNKFLSSLSFAGNFYSMPFIIRFINEVFQLDQNKILDLCYQGRKKDYISGSNFEIDELLKLAKLDYSKRGYYGIKINLSANSMFESLYFDEYDQRIGGSFIRLVLKEGRYLPPMPIPGKAFYVNVFDTILGQYIPETIQEKDLPGPYSKYVLSMVPACLLKAQSIHGPLISKENQEAVHFAHCKLNKGAKSLYINTPNVLDGVMTLVFLTRVVDPLNGLYFRDK